MLIILVIIIISIIDFSYQCHSHYYNNFIISVLYSLELGFISLIPPIYLGLKALLLL
jgi:hypothetical protein